MEEFIQNWGYLALFLYSFGGGFLALVVASAFAYAGDLNIYICVVVAGSANFIGSQFLFYMAKHNKSFADGILKNHRRKVALVNVLLNRFGIFIIFIQKYIYGVKTLIPLVMGLSFYNSIKFSILNFIASFLWAVVIGYVSFTAGKVLLSFADDIKYLGLVTVAIVFIILLVSFRKSKKRAKKRVQNSEV